jgi:hypothetical protein
MPLFYKRVAQEETKKEFLEHFSVDFCCLPFCSCEGVFCDLATSVAEAAAHHGLPCLLSAL